VRSRADVDGIRDALASTSKVVVAGGGYIGLEVAASLVKLGKQVVVIEATERVLARVAGPKLSSFFEAAHRSCGVEIRTRSQIVAVAGENGRVSGVHLHNGDIIAAQMLIVGIGIVPAVAPLLDCGAEGGNGVAVDEHCRTSLPDIYAVGDCALHVNRHARNTALRIESVQNAVDQANVAAKAIVGKPVAYDATPWFWSNQYELRLQTIGLSAGHDAEVVRGDPATSTFSVVYLRQGKVIALDCVNAPRDYVQGRKLVAEGIACDQALLGDASVSLKSFCA
jgi:3-phenylpropionate/trans-cinnamate dioxygenase ferredoxin reductase subunit